MTKISFTIMFIVIGTILFIAFSSFMPEPKPEMVSLTVEVHELRNSKGTVQFAINILHDEDNNGKIKKGIIFPGEGIGFFNY
jgi:uncharacterized protein (DUF2141 family)